MNKKASKTTLGKYCEKCPHAEIYSQAKWTHKEVTNNRIYLVNCTLDFHICGCFKVDSKGNFHFQSIFTETTIIDIPKDCPYTLEVLLDE